MSAGAGAGGIGRPDAVVFDWGGVLTAPLREAFGAWLATDGVDPDHFGAVMRRWLEALPEAGSPDPPAATDAPDAPRGAPAPLVAAAVLASPVHDLERGTLAAADFEAALAAALAEQGSAVVADGLLARMMRGLAALEADMVDLVREVRRRGARTALLSNSWGEHYPAELFDGLFDVVVISGREGLRKPDPEIFDLVARRLDLAPGRCLLVDDLPANVAAAQAAGMPGVLHVSPAGTRRAVLAALGAVQGGAGEGRAAGAP